MFVINYGSAESQGHDLVGPFSFFFFDVRMSRTVPWCNNGEVFGIYKYNKISEGVLGHEPKFYMVQSAKKCTEQYSTDRYI